MYFSSYRDAPVLHSFPTRRSSDLLEAKLRERGDEAFEVENAVLSVLAKMMDNRVPVNVEYAREQHGKFMQYCDDMEAWCKDRKSTRLNSSHGYISYAVFCLKKKTL